jgi:hypothetical protein
MSVTSDEANYQSSTVPGVHSRKRSYGARDRTDVGRRAETRPRVFVNGS